MGGFTYPRGMAGTKRIQNIITALKQYPDIAVQVILQRQSSADNTLAGVYEGTLYETVMGDILRGRMLLVLPLLYRRTVAALKAAFRPGYKNVIYFYGPLFIESVVPLYFARRLGYRIVFDVNEDIGLARDVSRSFQQYVRSSLANLISSRIGELAAGVVAISSCLEEKCGMLAGGTMPVHYMPISVDMSRFPVNPYKEKPNVTLLYAGSFGKKDGLPVLLDAFDRLAGRYGNVRLFLTGRGDREAMSEFNTRMETSPHKDRIVYKGYLDEKEYYSLLNDADIPCMTRIDNAYAHAGFPFKLGEFLATGKPVIASRVSDVERFLVHGQNALLVNAGSSAEVCEAAEFLIKNHDAAAVIGARGRLVAESYFDHKQQGMALRTFLENVLNGR